MLRVILALAISLCSLPAMAGPKEDAAFFVETFIDPIHWDRARKWTNTQSTFIYRAPLQDMGLVIQDHDLFDELMAQGAGDDAVLRIKRM